MNQIRTWVRQGRTDAWIAHQLEVSVSDIRSFKREHELVADDAAGNGDDGAAGAAAPEELDLRAEDDAAVAAALEAEQEAGGDEPDDEEESDTDSGADDAADDDDDDKPKRRRRGRRGGRGRRRKQALEGTFDHGDEGYGLWLDPAIQDDPVYAEHWAGHRPVVVSVDAERIVITRAGEGEDGSGDEDED